MFPNKEYGRIKGWKYQVSWYEDGNYCFIRVRFMTEAEHYKDRLEADGLTDVKITDLEELWH